MRLCLIVGTLGLLTLLDIMVVDNIYHHLHKQGVPWDMLHTRLWLPWGSVTTLSWHPVFFIIAMVCLLGQLGTTRNWRAPVCTFLLFLGGWEDFLYYVWHRKWLPDDLSILQHIPVHRVNALLVSDGIVGPAAVYLSMLQTAVCVWLILRKRA